MYMQSSCPVLEKRAIARGIFDYKVFCPEIAAASVPGQFAQIAVEGFFLRRPVSICEIDKDRGTLRFVFEVRGKGTEKLSHLNSGEVMDIIAPLGKGFRVIEGGAAVCVGGGIGVPPMLGISQIYSSKARVISGFRTAAAAILQDDLKKAGCQTILCTDDGTAGIRGFVTDALRTELQSKKADIIYACGPLPMLKGVAAAAQEYDIPCEVSLEQRMACGVGACLGCVCRTVKDGSEIFSHVCKDGPVFDSREVIFDG